MTGTTKPSGTQPPFSCVSSTEKSTRKLAQHAPRVRQGCSDDMGGEDLRTCVGKAKFSLIFLCPESSFRWAARFDFSAVGTKSDAVLLMH